MGKQGPCHHCGVTSTPLWRHGPPEKPVLCNACGSRWRTKGTLVNYTPLRARAEPDDFDYKIQKAKKISFKNKEAGELKRKHSHDTLQGGGTATDYSYGFIKGAGPSGVALDYNQRFLKGLDEDIRSSSGSAISNSESCLHPGNADASDLIGADQSIVWDTMVPSRKRTCVNRSKPSSIEKLTKDLYTILHEQPPYFTVSSEEDLLIGSDATMVSVEMGHGSVLMRHPSSIACEEESEASSLSFDNKQHSVSEAYSQFSSLGVHIYSKGIKSSSLGAERTIKPDQKIEKDQLIREKAQQEKLQSLANPSTTLCGIELKDVKCKNSTGRSVAAGHAATAFASAQSMKVKRPRDGQFPKFSVSGGKTTVNSLKRVLMKTNYEKKELVDNDTTCFSPKSLFALPPDDASLILDSFRFAENSNQDLLLNVPSHSSFPQGELLVPTSSFGAQAGTTSS